MKAAPGILPLRLDGVCFEAGGRRLIDGISLELRGGSRTLVLGPNGAGKSLLLRLCHGLIEPSHGTITWAGAGPGNGEASHRQAMVFQRPVMLRRSAAANIDYALSLRGLGRGERRVRTGEVLEKTGLKDLAGRPARVLSGGEQQRLALARAWALRPEVLFLDEPTANLDPAASRAVERIIDAIHRGGTKIVMTTHDLGQARRLADEVLFIHDGRLTERAAAAQFFEQPGNPAADAFMRGELTW
jgi:tungstate transport system ATP-binding protein